MEAMKHTLNNHPNSETEPLNSTTHSGAERQMQVVSNQAQYQQRRKSLYKNVKEQNQIISKNRTRHKSESSSKIEKKSRPSSRADKTDKKRTHSRSPNRSDARDPRNSQSFNPTTQNPQKYAGAIPKTPQPSELPKPKWSPMDYSQVNWPPLAPVKDKKNEKNETMSQLEIEIRDFKSRPEYRSAGSNEYENSYSGQEGLSTESEHIKKGPKKPKWEVWDNKHLYHRSIKERLETDAHSKDDTDYWTKRRDEEKRREENTRRLIESTTFPLGSWADTN